MKALDSVPTNVFVVAAETRWLILSRQRMMSTFAMAMIGTSRSAGSWSLSTRLLYSDHERDPFASSVESHCLTAAPNVRFASVSAGSSPDAIFRCVTRWSSSAASASRFESYVPTYLALA